MYKKYIQHLPLKLQITLFSTSIVAVVLIISAFSYYKILSDSIEESIGENALELTHFLSNLPAVREALKEDGSYSEIEYMYHQYLDKADDEIMIVLVDQTGVRKFHPNQSLIGQTVTGDDVDRALQGESYISRAEGISGPTLRTWVPVIDPDTNEQLGVIAIGYLKQNINNFIQRNLDSIILGLFIAFSIGIIASIMLSSQIKKILYNHEPDEIAKLFIEREKIFESLNEGIIVFDKKNKLRLINQSAKDILSLPNDLDNESLYNLVKDFSIIKDNSNVETKDLELNVHNTPVLANHYPMKNSDEQIWGHIITFSDISEVRHMAEKLTGVQQYVDGLRAKTHEFSNKLQTITGLIELQCYDEVLEYVSNTNKQQQQLLEYLTRNILEPKILGLLLGKTQQALELNVSLKISPGSHIHRLPANISVDSLVLIMGNLLQNSIDAVKNQPNGEVHLTLLDKNDVITILIEDNGSGITENDVPYIFDKGHSSKGTLGFGLYLVKHHTENLLGGEIHFSQEDGTCFTVRIPKQKGVMS
ncbi:ATP-binding protein [Alkalihalobacillus sp. 1P02AB]|uniref:ATP-binding protein n=1 Tax=Alkalihalobacillus sp. 1P02AB TaxID=3132260 RepID=UPI0039A68B9A